MQLDYKRKKQQYNKPKIKKTMKKQIFISVAGIFVSVFALNAQIKIISNGNVGVGTDSPQEKLHINGSVRGNQNGALRISTGNGYIDVGPMNTSFAHFYTDRSQFYFSRRIIINEGIFSSFGTNDLKLCTGTTCIERITINNSTGNVGIGKAPHATYKLDVAGDIASNGVKITSDIRLKDEVKPIKGNYEKLALLQPISFKYKKPENFVAKNFKANTNDTANAIQKENINSESFYNQTRYGFSAQEIQKVYPELVTEDEDGMLAVDYIGLIPIMIEVIKTQQARIAELEKKVAALSGTKPR
jgi:hypothetical protein